VIAVKVVAVKVAAAQAMKVVVSTLPKTHVKKTSLTVLGQIQLKKETYTVDQIVAIVEMFVAGVAAEAKARAHVAVVAAMKTVLFKLILTLPHRMLLLHQLSRMLDRARRVTCLAFPKVLLLLNLSQNQPEVTTMAETTVLHHHLFSLLGNLNLLFLGLNSLKTIRIQDL
jgi:hypothetical protein